MGIFTYYINWFFSPDFWLPSTVVRIFIHQLPAFRILSVCVQNPPPWRRKTQTWARYVPCSHSYGSWLASSTSGSAGESEGLKPSGGVEVPAFFLVHVVVTLLKTNMTLENHHFQWEIHLHSWWIFQCHVSFQGCMGDFFVRGSLFNGPGFWSETQGFRSQLMLYRLARWWQLKCLLFSKLFGVSWSNLTNIFQMGWFNHQLVVIYITIVIIFIFMTLLAFKASLSCIDGGS